MTSFKKLFTTPTFDDEIKSQQAYMLHIILWTLVFVPIAFFFYTLFLNPENLRRTILQASFAESVNILLLFLLYGGYVRAASIIQVSAFWLFFTFTAFTGGGVHGESYLLGYGLVIGVAGILLGGVGASVFTVLSLIAGGLMVYTQTLGTDYSSYPSTPLTTWVLSLLLFPIGALLQYLASRTTRTTLSRARASEEKYRLISQVSSDYIFATEVYKDGSASLSWVAGAFEKMTEYTYEEYVATGGWLAHVHPDDLEKDAQDMEKLSKNQDVKSEIRSLTKNGEIRWEQIFAHPVWDEKENRLSGIFGAVRDITEQKQVEAALAHERDLLQIFMDNIPDQVYFKDAESRFVRINQAQARFLGIDDPQDALGKTDLDFQNPELARELLMQEKQIIETGQPTWNHLEFNPTEDGAPRWLSTTKVPAKNEFGQTIGIIGTSRNITSQKMAEELEQNRRIMLEKVVKLGQNVTEVHDLRTTLERIWHGVHDDLGFDRLGIYLYNPKRNSMDGTFGTSIHGEMIDEWHTWVSLEQENLEAGLFLRLLENPNRTYLTHTYEKDFNIPEGHTMSGVKDFAAIAASAGDKPVAVLCVDYVITGRPITEEQLEALRLFAGYAGLAIENTRLNTALQSELSQHKETLLHQSAILNGIPDMAWLKDVEGRYIAVNEQFAAKTGMKIEDIIGKTDLDIWQKNYAEKYIKDDIEIMRTRRSKTAEELEIDSAGKEYWMETTKTPILNAQDEVIGTTGVAREINTRKITELERELLITELEAKNAELERYTYTVSHDLKSPLVTIRGFLGYLEKDALTGNTQKIKDDIKRIENATQKMHALLNDLLELSRIGRLMNESTDMLFTDIAKDAINLVHGQIEVRNVLIEIDDTPVIVHGDRTRLTEVIQNLVDNAVKFMGDQPSPHITIGATKNKQNETIFFVCDNGIGIDSQYHERIFTLFNKLNASTEGTGIGLTLIKRIIEVHKGRIWLESELGKGTTFYFTLNQT